MRNETFFFDSRHGVKNSFVFKGLAGILFFLLFSNVGHAQLLSQTNSTQSDQQNLNLPSFSEARKLNIQVENFLRDNYRRDALKNALAKHFEGPAEDLPKVVEKFREMTRVNERKFFVSCRENPSEVGHLMAEYQVYASRQIKYIAENFYRLPKSAELPYSPPQFCENMDMEDCDFTNWTLYRGNINGVPFAVINRTQTVNFTTGLPQDDQDAHYITNTAVQDPLVPLTVVRDGGSCSAAIGDRLGDGRGASVLARTFTVQAAMPIFTYSYSVVMENPSNAHTPGEMPFFEVKMYQGPDNTGPEIPCSNFQVYAGDGNPAWVAAPFNANNASYDPLIYTNWAQAFIPLSNYVGQQVTIEFSVGDCDLSGHAAYAYVEAECIGQLQVNNPIICPGDTATLTAPGGAQVYNWSTGETATEIQTVETGDYWVAVQSTVDGCVDTLRGSVSARLAPTANFTADTVCVNTPTTFTDLSVPITTFATWEWDVDNDQVFDGTGQNFTHSFATGGDHTVTLRATDDNTCSHDTTFQVFVLRPPLVDFSTSPICEGDSTHFTSIASNYESLTWDFLNDGSALSTDSNPSFLYPAVGAQPVEVVAVSPDGCQDSITKNIVVNPVPVAAFTHVDACFPLPIAFTDQSSVASGAIAQWSWDFGDTLSAIDVSFIQNPSFAYDQFGTYQTRLIVRSDSGCVDTITSPVMSFEKPDVSFELNDTCQNEVFNMLNLSSVSTSTFDSWSWDIAVNGVVDYTTENASHTLPDAGSENIRLIGETAQGCRDTVENTVDIHPLPTANFTATRVCEDQATAFTQTAIGTISSFEWDFTNDGIVNADSENPTFTFDSPGSHDVELKVTTDRGCLDSVLLPVIVTPNPVPDFSAAEVCFPFETVFTNNSTITSGNITQTNWDFGDQTGTSTQSDPTYTYGAFGTYQVKLVVVSDSSCSDSITLPVQSFEKPVVNFTVNDTCQNEPFNLQNTSTVSSSTFDSWSWDVNINGSVEYTTENATHILSAAGQDSVVLYGETAQGCRDTATQIVTIDELPTAFFVALDVCDGTAMQFEDRAVGNLALYEWDFLADGSVESNEIEPGFLFAGPGTFPVEMKVTSADGCLDSIELNVTVDPMPIPSFTNTTVCEPNATEFSSSVSLVSGFVSDYSWSFGDSGSPTGGNSTEEDPSYAYSGFGNYNAQLLVTTDQNCSDSITNQVTVFEKPQADFALTDICVFNAVALNSTSASSSSQITQWSWDVINNGVEDYGSENATHTYADSGQYPITLIVETNESCRDTLTDTVVIFAQPVAEFTVTDVCDGLATEYTDQSSTPQGTLTNWSWDFEFGDGVVESNDQNTTRTYVGEGIYITQLIVTNSNACLDTVIDSSIVYPLPVPDFTVEEACLNQLTRFLDQSQISNAVTSNSVIDNSWDYGDGVSGQGITGSHSYQTHGNFDVTMTTTTNNGCVDSVTKTVFVHPLPQIDLSTTEEKGCTEHCIDFTDESTVVTGLISEYLWEFEDGQSSTDAFPSMCFENLTQEIEILDFSLRVVSDEGCVADTIVENYIQIYPQTIADFNYAPEIVDDLNPEYQFENLSVGTIWSWDFGDGDSSTVFEPSHEYPAAGLYDVTLVSNNAYNCPDSITKPLEVLPTTAFYIPNAFTPNEDGTNDVFYVYGHNIQELDFSILDRWGLVIFTSSNIEDGWDGTYKGNAVQQDVYVYKGTIIDVFNEEHQVTGTVTLIR